MIFDVTISTEVYSVVLQNHFKVYLLNYCITLNLELFYLFIITVDLLQAFGWKYCLQYLLGQLQYPGEMKSEGYEKLWRANEDCIMGEVKMANLKKPEYKMT